jgi:hypothetical protein
MIHNNEPAGAERPSPYRCYRLLPESSVAVAGGGAGGSLQKAIGPTTRTEGARSARFRGAPPGPVVVFRPRHPGPEPSSTWVAAFRPAVAVKGSSRRVAGRGVTGYRRAIWAIARPRCIHIRSRPDRGRSVRVRALILIPDSSLPDEDPAAGKLADRRLMAVIGCLVTEWSASRGGCALKIDSPPSPNVLLRWAELTESI